MDDEPEPAVATPYAPVIWAMQWVDATKVEIRATIDGVERFVPVDENNRDYQAIMAWVAKSNLIADPPET